MRNRAFATGSEQDRSLQGFKTHLVCCFGRPRTRSRFQLRLLYQGSETRQVRCDHAFSVPRKTTFHSARRRLPRCREASTDIRFASSPTRNASYAWSIRTGSKRRFEFHQRSQLFIRTHNETLRFRRSWLPTSFAAGRSGLIFRPTVLYLWASRQTQIAASTE